MKHFGIVSTFLVLLPMTPLAGQAASPWNGYVQLRFQNESDAVRGFEVRRAKLWAWGVTPFGENLHYKVQGVFRSSASGGFTLQDAYGEYRAESFAVRVGQMVPDFSLERNQPDATIPLVERAAAINTLIPSGESGARDIGASLFLVPPSAGFHASIGVFNGNGGNRSGNDDSRFLVTGRVFRTTQIGSNASFQLGASIAYRQADSLPARKILGTSAPVSGDDWRWAVESRVEAGRWVAQGEYLRATVADSTAWGYYVLLTYDFNSENQLAVSIENIDLPVTGVSNKPWYVFGYNHFIVGHRAKIMVDARAQFLDSETRTSEAVQCQLFFN